MLRLLPRPLPHLPSVNSIGDSQNAEKDRKLADERGVEGVGEEEPNHTTAEKAWSSIYHSILAE
jgi:hypothetical protein